MQIVVLGAGRVGSAIAADLAKDEAFEVRAADRDAGRLAHLLDRHGIRGERVDFSLPSTTARAIRGADLVVSAVPGFLGFRTLRAIIDAKVNVVDIAFFAQDPFELDAPARKNGVVAIVDCGVAPGMSNLLVGHADRLLERTESVAIYVGGLPTERIPPYEYRAVFSPIDVIEEYTRPARLVVDGLPVTRPALSDVELLDFGESAHWRRSTPTACALSCGRSTLPTCWRRRSAIRGTRRRWRSSATRGSSQPNRSKSTTRRSGRSI